MTNKSKLVEQIEIEKPQKAKRGRPSLASRIEKSSKGYVMDLRIHTPSSMGCISLSSLELAPAVVSLAKVKGLDIIAVTDFFTGLNVNNVKKAAKNTSITVIPGTVIRCTLNGCNDVLLSCLFPESFKTIDIEKFLLSIGVPKTQFGNEDYLLETPFEDILSTIEKLGGIVIPTTMDKTPYRKSIIPTLVEKYGFRVFDLAYYPDSTYYFKHAWPNIKFHFLSFSNARALAQIGNRFSKVPLSHPGFSGIKGLASREFY